MHNEQQAIYQAILAAQAQHLATALATVISTTGSMPRHAGAKMLIYADGRIVGTIGGGAMEAQVIQAGQAVMQSGQARMESYTLNSLENGDFGICGGTASIFIEAISLSPTLLVIGAGHVGKSLAELAKWIGYRVLLADDRAEYCNPEAVPNLDAYYVCPASDITQQVTINASTYIAAVTRGLVVDLALFPALLATEAAYIGLIGSRRRCLLTMQKLVADYGVTQAQIQRIHAPIGLELEAETPQEIALSIMAEITMHRRGGTGHPMRYDSEK